MLSAFFVSGQGNYPEKMLFLFLFFPWHGVCFFFCDGERSNPVAGRTMIRRTLTVLLLLLHKEF